jgi:hypothetical protein
VLEKLLFGVEVGWPYLSRVNLYSLDHAANILLGEGEKDRAYELLGIVEEQRHQFNIRKDYPFFSLMYLLDEDLPPHLAAAVERGRGREMSKA